MSGEAASHRLDKNDEEFMVVDAETLRDTRTFPARVYDMVSVEDTEDHGLILWEDSGNQFAMARESCRIDILLEKHIGKGDPKDFERRLFKHGWELDISISNPGTHVAYRNIGFRRGMDRENLKFIKRQRKSGDGIGASTPTQHKSPQARTPAAAGSRSISAVNAEVRAVAPNQGDSAPRRSTPRRSRLQNPQDAGESSELEGEANSLPDEEVIAGNRQGEPRPVADESDDNEQEVIEIIDDDDDEDNDTVIQIEDDDDDDDDSDSDIEVLLTVPSPSTTQTTPSPASKNPDSLKQSAHSSSLDENMFDSRASSAASPGLTKQSSATEETTAEEAEPVTVAKTNSTSGKNQATEPLPISRDSSFSTADPSLPFRLNTRMFPPTWSESAKSLKPPPKSQSCKLIANAKNTTTKGGSVARMPSTESLEEMSTEPACTSSESIGRASNPESLIEDSKPAALPRQSPTVGEGNFGIKPSGGDVHMTDQVSDGISPTEDEVTVPLVPPVDTLRASPSSMDTASDGDDTLNAKSSVVKPAQDANDGFRELQEDGVETSVEGVAAAATLRLDGHGQNRSKPLKSFEEINKDDFAEIVKGTLFGAEEDTASKNQERLKKALDKRNKVIREASNRQASLRAKPRVFEDRLISTKDHCFTTNQNPTKRNVWMTVTKSGNEEKTICVRLEGVDAQQPRHNAPISLSRWKYIDDEPELGFVPYFPDSDEKVGKVLNDFYFTGEREKRIARGATYEEESRNKELDFTLKSICEEFCPQDSQGRFDESLLKRLRPRIAEVVVDETDITERWFNERFELLTLEEQHESGKKNEDSTSAEDKEWKEYMGLVDNYRFMLCTRCMTYCCSFHGSGDEQKPTLELQYEKCIQRVKDGYWKSVEFAPKITRAKNDVILEYSKPVTRLSQSQEALCKRMFLIFRGDVKKIAGAVRAPTAAIADFIASERLQLPQRSRLANDFCSVANKKQTMKTYNKKWLDNINRTISHPWCQPCGHEEPCSESSCSCVQNAFFCTKACSHAEYSPNFFRGCNCKSICSQNSCPCFAANRECDPDLCKTCGACSDPPNTHERVSQRCHNDNMSMRRHRRLLVGESTVAGAGWGLFTKDRLKKGDFIHEYLGELISQEEAERRGNLYDLQCCTYIFNQSSDFAVDATLKGNKPRFGNHSNTPNVDTKKMFVNGNVRIGFFANQNIQAQSELFINYDSSFKGVKDKKGDQTNSWSKHNLLV